MGQFWCFNHTCVSRVPRAVVGRFAMASARQDGGAGAGAATVEPLTRASQRELCYAARDGFYACLDTNNGDAATCTAQAAAYKDSCMRSWVRSHATAGGCLVP